MSLKKRKLSLLAAGMAFLLCASLAATLPANATTTITAYKAQSPVTIDGVVSPGEWNDTPLITESTSGVTYAFKQNGTGLLFLLEWQQSSTFCYDRWCFGGIEIANLGNSGEMGSPTAPTIMVLLSQGFANGYDEFISTGDTTPAPVEQQGYTTQSVCALSVANGNYIAECYRPFQLTNASPYDPFPAFASGSPMEIGFAVGEFSSPGLHEATDMSTYTLAPSSQAYVGQTTTSSTSTQSTGTATISQSTHTSTTSHHSGSNWLTGFPGLNLVTLEIFAGVALIVGVLLGIGAAFRAKKVGASK